MPIQPISQLTTRTITWLWPGRLALGKLAILEGDPGLGKSLVTLDLCARLSTGRAFPDGSACGHPPPNPSPQAPSPPTPLPLSTWGEGRRTSEPANSLILNGEDNAADTIRPRLQALGADLDRVFVLEADHQAGERLWQLPNDLDRLKQAITRTKARLVIIDPVNAFLAPGIMANNDQSVRQALLPLAQLAQELGCCILLIRHLNKCSGQRSLYRGGGSIGFLGVCRSGWLIARDPGQPTQCVMAQVKNNLAPPQPSLAYTLQELASWRQVSNLPEDSNGKMETCHQEPDPKSPRRPLTLTWLGEHPLAADQLLAASPTAGSPNPLKLAKDFLLGFLESGPQPVREIWSAACRQGLRRRTLRRAKLDLDIRSSWLSLEGKPQSYWRLAHQDPPAPLDLEPWLSRLRQQFPPASPLDDL
jgi:AAA domain